MAKRKERQVNPEPFDPDGNESIQSKSRSKAAKHHQKGEKLISSRISSKIMKEAMLQQKEIQEEAEAFQGNANSAFFQVEEPPNVEDDDDDDIDEFAGFSETQSQFGGYDEEINEEDERVMEAFLLKDQGRQRTLADLIVERIKEKDAAVASEVRPVPKLDKSILDIYKGVGIHLSKYTAGKIPKPFKHIPAMKHWEEILYVTQPENWSPNAIYQATRIFSSNLGVKKAERFYKLVLLPRVREDIRKNKRLHFALYQSLKKSLYKPAAFFKGILFPLCESRTCTLREAVVIGSIIQKVSIPPLHSSVALLKLAEMEYCGTTSYFIKLLVEKKYALPYRVVDAVVSHFTRFVEETRIMPVIWHQSLLAFVQRYKNELRKEEKDNLRDLLDKQKHRLVTPEIIRELNHSRNRGEKEDDLMSISSPISFINKPIEEDRFDIPEVPMEED
ncbi:bystin [Prosopis cineraria]|uniref:bystin n=1 Tax=Prosopis cineraria TaxID=364024 RepID=UPI00240EAE09|nr:bystin [Prosopis cineraria]XP_054815333.1 bystin [Prosopis cineraria]